MIGEATMNKRNCWEVKQCGREPGGSHEKDLGVCPAAVEIRLDNVHGGKNAGRCCWAVAGTLCQGAVQGTFAQKYRDCEKCDFYNQVKREEAHRFVLSAVMLSKLKGK
jgi:hypothetical protein